MQTNERLFFEAHAAAQSMKNAWTRLASTYGCIMVLLTREKLVIRPHWFASWLVGLLRLDLRHEIPVTNIRGLTDMGKWGGMGKVEVRFVTAQGDNRAVWLYLKRYSEFIQIAKQTISQ
jgi:hypothetical protein